MRTNREQTRCVGNVQFQCSHGTTPHVVIGRVRQLLFNSSFFVPLLPKKATCAVLYGALEFVFYHSRKSKRVLALLSHQRSRACVELTHFAHITDERER
mmetsp:Transcript_19269/g.41648  ORF Transcript_19269/g.41648 Transcript_19269/m.41648 type:complete len:99 (+) Transcript_19269:1264-1560(+)|eukprot:scaffold5914_cov210-Alexandrium_tamarense.AAC.1